MQGLRFFLSTYQNTKILLNGCKSFISGGLWTKRNYTIGSRLSFFTVRLRLYRFFGKIENIYRTFQNDYFERYASTRTLTENDIVVIKLSGNYDNRLEAETAKAKPKLSEIEQKKGEFLLKATPVTLVKLLAKRDNQRLLLLM